MGNPGIKRDDWLHFYCTVAWFKINVRYTCSSPSYSLNIAIAKAGQGSREFAVMVLQSDWKVFCSCFVAAAIWNDKVGFSTPLNRLNYFLTGLSKLLFTKKGIFFQFLRITDTVNQTDDNNMSIPFLWCTFRPFKHFKSIRILFMNFSFIFVFVFLTLQADWAESFKHAHWPKGCILNVPMI